MLRACTQACEHPLLRPEYFASVRKFDSPACALGRSCSTRTQTQRGDIKRIAPGWLQIVVKTLKLVIFAQLTLGTAAAHAS
jgi:hypothetical protein